STNLRMDFFQRQDEARKASRLLVLYFVLAVIAIILSVHLAVSFLLWVSSDGLEPFDWWQLDRFIALAGAALFVIVAGSLYKIMRLSEGGHAVARLLGGRPIDPNTTDPAERRLLNVVEEMAIASGLPVPTVYLLDREEGINAFAAGFTPQDAALGVTKGTIRILNREELQGVVAHEFSHIFNGDMRINLRLMGVLHGILVIGLIGYFILRSTVRAAASRRKGGGALALLPLVGVALVAIGYVGVFFGRVIKSAVSRQREFLADASAVQFTRNPHGVASALKKIGGLVQGSLIMSPHAEQASHFFFSDGKLGRVRMALAGSSPFDFLASHPPLPERIRRVEPSWNGVYPKVDPNDFLSEEPPADVKEGSATKLFAFLPAQLTAIVGTLDRAHVDYARGLLSRIPDRVSASVRDPAGARAVVLALLASTDPAVREKQYLQMSSADDELLDRDTREIRDLLESSPREIRLPLLDLALPALRTLSRSQYDAFMEQVESFVRADRQIDLFEYTLSHVLKRHLEPRFQRAPPPSVEFYALGALHEECSVLLSAMAHAGQKEGSAAERAFREGAKELDGLSLSLLPLEQAGLARVRDSLNRLERLAPRLKKDLLRAFIATVAFDRKVTVGEGEVLRAIADALGLPMPPFLPGQTIESKSAEPAS
ncbi:MAG: M48 family metallopeptidase, partial [Vicinamibacteria bacterium]